MGTIKRSTKNNEKIRHFRILFPAISAVFGLFLSLFVFVSFATTIAGAATIYWDGTGDGTNWTDGSNWVGDSEPGPADDVIINTNDTVDIGNTRTINSLTLGNTSGDSTPTLNFSYDAVTNGALIIDDGNLTTYSGSDITHSAGTADVVGTVYIDVQTGNADINGTVNLNSKGYQQSEGAGAGTDIGTGDAAGGGAHGGDGGTGAVGTKTTGKPGGTAYGSITAPVTMGSGGGNSGGYNGGDGGGLINLTVNGTLTVAGDITANGGNGGGASGQASGGGAGGGAYFDVGTITGAGSITANGGAGGNATNDGGGGAGGRIAINYDTYSFSGTLTAYGGSGASNGGQGGAGTIYKKDNASSYGDLDVDNGGYSKATLEDQRHLYGTTPIAATTTFEDITISNNGEITVNNGATLSYTTLTYTGGTIVEDGTINLPSDYTVPASSIYVVNTAKTFDSLTVNGTIAHSHNDTAPAYSMNLTINNDMTIGSGGALDLDYRGYRGSYGDGQGTDVTTGNAAGGGAYGGDGGFGGVNVKTVGKAGGTAYGSTTTPTAIGSGGGNSSAYPGGKGGGLVSLTVNGTLTVTGDITSNGSGGSGGGSQSSAGGSGGGIYLDVNTITGGGNITADGGAGGNADTDGGGGAGGRIAINYDTYSFSGTLSAVGGLGPGIAGQGGAGTIYKKDNASSYGDLTIDNGSYSKDSTENKRHLYGTTPIASDAIFEDIIVSNNGELTVNNGVSIYYSTLTYTGGTVVERGTINFGPFITIPATATYILDRSKGYSNITVNGTLAHTHNDTAPSYSLSLIAENMTIGSGGVLDLDDRGFMSSYGDGQGTDAGYGQGSGGGAYGGDGGDGSTGITGGTAYGSETMPASIGSGAGNNVAYAGGKGAGLASLEIHGTLTVTGDITANGGDGSGSAGQSTGGGSGGGLYLNVGTITGAGNITANGGDGGNYDSEGGGGGGGRIAIYYGTYDFSGTLTATGGNGPNLAEDGVDGTIYKSPKTVLGSSSSADAVAHWALDESRGTTIYDKSGNGNHGTMYDMNETNWVSGKYGGGLYFDGDNDVVRITESSSTDLGETTDSYTVAAWVKTAGNPNAAAATFVCKNDNSGNFPFCLYQLASDTVRFHIGQGGNPTVTTPTAYTDDRWHYFVGVRDVIADKLYLYVDGVKVAEADDTTTDTAANDDDITIGNAGASGYTGYDFPGSIDDARIYDYARTPSQIIEDMNAGHPLGGSPIGSQVVYWKLDESYGSTANDDIGNTNGTITNATWETSENCEVNSCLNFDAANEVVTIATANDEYVDFNDTEEFSGSAWVYPTTMAGSGEQDAIIAKWDATGAQRGYRLFLENDDGDTTGNFQVEIFDETTDEVITATAANDTVSLNTWYHVSFTFNGGTGGSAGDLSLYVNGVLIDQNSANGSFTGLDNVTSDFTVGEYDTGDSEGANTAFTGRVDEVKIYSAELTEAQTKIDMNYGSSSSYSVLGATERSALIGTSTTDPIFYMALDENIGLTAYDSSKSGDDGSLTNMSNDSWVTGKKGSALTFDGDDDHIRIDPGSVAGTLTGDYTVMGWMKAKNFDSARTIVSFSRNNGASGGFGLYVDSDSTLGFVTWGRLDYDGTTTVNANEWMHIAAVMDESDDVNFYVNGKYVETVAGSGSTYVDDNDYMLIGSSTANGSLALASQMYGEIDEVKVFDYILSPAQIAYEYNRGKPAVWLKFDECTSTTANDSSDGGTYNGTITIGGSGDNTTEGTCSGDTGAWGDGEVGKIEYSLDFDGEDDYVTITSEDNNFSIDNFSASAWVYRSATAPNAEFIISNEDADNDGWSMTLNNDDTVTCSYNASDADSVSTLSTNTWYHVACTSDGSNVRVYINGIEEDSQSLSGSIAENTDVRIGARSYSIQDYFTGQIDDVRIFNYRLSTDQVKKIMINNSTARFE